MDLAAATRLSSIVTQMEQLQTQIQDRRRQLNSLLRSVRTMDPARREARIEDARERIRALERRSKSEGRREGLGQSVDFLTKLSGK